MGESYPFNKTATVLLADNHNSVNGIRELPQQKWTIRICPVQYEDLQINDAALKESLTKCTHVDNNLFCLPCTKNNVSGVKHSLSWIQYAHDLGYDVLLDAAAFVPLLNLT